MKRILNILIISILFFSCNTQTSDNKNPLIRDHKRMANLLFDIHLTESLESNNFLLPKECKYIYTKIFEKHRITPEQFDSALNYYANNNFEHQDVYILVLQKINKYTELSNHHFFNKYPETNKNIWKDYAIYPDSIYKVIQTLPYNIVPRPEYLEEPLILKN